MVTMESLSRKIRFWMEFPPGGEFVALRRAEAWLADAGLSVGPGCAVSKKRGIKAGSLRIAKWRNLRPEEIDMLDGYMTAKRGDFRNGPVFIHLYDFTDAMSASDVPHSYAPSVLDGPGE